MRHKIGIVIFAENNEQINYVDIATANAHMIKNHMNVSVSIATSDDVIDKIFDNVIKIPKSDEQTKSFIGYGKYEKLSYYNSNRTSIYDITPYNETIMIDADYLILDNSLNLCWGSDEEIMMSDTATNLYGGPMNLRERRLFDTNIPMSWATVVYFKKSERAKIFFKLVQNIQKNYAYYAGMFNIQAGLFRNDYAFSIASHLMSEAQTTNVKPLPDHVLLTSTPADKIMKIRKGKIDLVSKVDEWHYPVQMKQNFHYLNKFDLSERAKDIVEEYETKN